MKKVIEIKQGPYCYPDFDGPPDEHLSLFWWWNKHEMELKHWYIWYDGPTNMLIGSVASLFLMLTLDLGIHLRIRVANNMGIIMDVLIR